MNIVILEVYSLIILIVLTVDYCVQFKNNMTKNSYIWLDMISFTAVLAIFNIILSTVSLDNATRIFIIVLSYLMAIMPQIFLTWYIQKNYVDKDKKNNKVFRVSTYLYTFLYAIFVFFALISDRQLFNNINCLQSHNYVLFLTIIPSFYSIISLIIKNKFVTSRVWRLMVTTLIYIIAITIDILNSSFCFLILSYVVSILILYITEYNSALNIDHLTGTYNRRAILQKNIFSNKEILAVCFIDIDKFKSINDVYGHHIGDKVLQDVANVLIGSVRINDNVIRYGGDEFVVVARINKEDDAGAIKNNILRQLKKYNQNNDIKISLSIGVDTYKNDMPIDKFIKTIDQKMYLEKNNKK